jgi:hypothetical protein
VFSELRTTGDCGELRAPYSLQPAASPHGPRAHLVPWPACYEGLIPAPHCALRIAEIAELAAPPLKWGPLLASYTDSKLPRSGAMTPNGRS